MNLDSLKNYLTNFSGRIVEKGGLLIRVYPFAMYEEAARHYGLRVAYTDDETTTVVFEKM